MKKNGSHLVKFRFKVGNIPHNKGKKFKFTCKNCDKEFERTEAYLKYAPRGFFCSMVCRNEHQKVHNENMLGSKNPNWKGGIHTSWIQRESIRLFGFNCQECGSNYIVDTHHIDGNHSNNPIDGSNWKRLCRKCHHKTHKIMRKNKNTYAT